MARLTFLAHGDQTALDAAIDACLARCDRSLRTRWRAISFLVRVRYEDQPTPAQPAAPRARSASGGNGRAPENSRGQRRQDQPSGSSSVKPP